MSLTFFNWAKKNLDFQPDLKSQCKLTHLLVGYGQAELAKPILDSIILDYPLGRIVSCFHKVANFETCSPVLCSVLEGYCRRGLFLEALEVYWKAKKLGTGTVSVYSCNALLSLLQDKNEVRLAWCFYGSMIRNGVSENQFTWSVVARILCKDGKFERICRILDMGICNPSVYSLIIQNYSERGKFDATFDYVAQMHDKKLDPSFSIYSSILDAACKYQDEKVINVVMAVMKDKGYLPKGLILEYDSIIQKVADLGKTYAAGLLFDRACAEKVELLDATYGCMLRALSNDGRMKDASRMYGIVRERKMVVKDSCYYAFVNGLCTQTPSKEIHDLLKDVIGKGFDPCVAQLSEHIKAQCEHCRWKEAEELLILILDKGLLPDADCCCSLVKYYCSRRQIDSAIMLHNKMKMLGGNFDIPSYNTLLNKLFKESRVEEALEVFDYMTMHKIFSTESFAIMIRELCYLKEFRKAMKLHDEMLRLGLKPNGRTYKRLISGFG
ncbi:pentatricopeptide repeat-containing protein At4g21170-like [Coffea arabica]|uniref:Pentatricopeptide repeat-containing protein At4g21170-like n=1 Tax=Coffea arabica TaxID=13443 RepID=A0A6P6VJJ2_COFAR|nr:pentatricopeptide repeat-containing protein At4g21170-like [Coffea arabica]XP_027108725.1 pentatricopeptide repeat-containing protein At4g21170-like [Coffea arabica]